MIRKNTLKACLTLILASLSLNMQAGVVSCTPDANTSFTDHQNMAFRITNDALGTNSLYSQCTDLSSEVLLGQLNSCAPALTNPINGLGLNPTDKLLYGLAPTDALGIGSHLEVTLPFPSPGQPGDIMKADDINVYKIGNDGGFQNIGSIQSPTETPGLPAGTNQVVPIVHSAASFNITGDLFVLAYRTNYTSSANIALGTAQILYQTPQIVIGKINNIDLISANGGTIATTWVNIDNTSDATCAALVNKFRDDTNVFSTCVVNDYLISGNEDTAVQSCLVSTPILDKGIHDFAVSPVNGHFYGYDSMTYDDRDVLVHVDPFSNIATCTEIADVGNATGVLSSLMFSRQNKLVAIFANQSLGNWIDVSNGTMTALPSSITSAPYSDGSSLPFAGFKFLRNKGTVADLIFANGFEPIIDLIFANGFEGSGIATIELDKFGVFVDASNDGFAQAGETIDYSFTVTNTGTLPLNNVSVDDPLITVAGSIATLAVATSDNSTFTGTYILTQTDIDNGSVANLATVNSVDASNNSVNAQSNGGTALITNLPTYAEMTLLKSGEWIDANNDNFAQAGETINYSFTVTNTGTLTLTNITITDPLINVPGSITTLPVSAVDNSTFSGVYTLTQADIDNGSVANSAIVNAADPANNLVTAQSNGATPLIVNLPSSASINLSKSGVFVDTNADNLAQAGETIDYTFSVENTGTLTLNNITIADPLMAVAGAIPTLAVAAIDNSTLTGTYVITQADIDNGSVANLATVNAVDSLNNAVSDQSNGGVSTVTNLPTSASISLIKTGAFIDTNNDGSAQLGETINYSFTVTNTGNLTLNNVTISDPLIPVSGNIATLAVSEIDSLTFSEVYILTQNDVDNGFVANLATVNAVDPSNNPVSAQSNAGAPLITNLVSTASINLTKAGVFVDANGDGLAQAGETIDYSFAVNNTGSLTLNTIAIADPLISVSGILASLAAGANDNSTFSGTYILTQADIDNGLVSNLATVNAFDPSNNPVSAQSNAGVSLITNLPTAASMTLVKTGIFVDTNGDNLAQVGESIDYSFTVTNTGNLTLSNVTISDPLMSVPGSIATLAVATSDNTTFSGTYILTQVDIDNGLVSNLAIVNAVDTFSNAVNTQSNNGVLLVTNLASVASISLVKAGLFIDTNMDGFAQVGETIDYTFTVTNTGTVTLDNVTITDPLISVPGNIATLAVGASDNSTFSGTYVLTQADIDNALVANLASVSSADPSANAITAQSNNGVTLITNLPIFSCPLF